MSRAFKDVIDDLANLAFCHFTAGNMSFTVLASTNLALPFSQWSNIGTALESPLAKILSE